MRDEYVQFIVDYGLTLALAAGAIGSPAYNTALTNYLNGLLTTIANVNTSIGQKGGKYVTSVSVPGNSVSFSSDLSLYEQASALLEAYQKLSGNVTIIRRTSARFF